MPSTLHEALVQLLRESPRLVPMLVAQALGKELDPGLFASGGADGADIQVTSAEFSELHAPEYRADLVLRIPGKGGRGRATRDTLIVEVQLAIDPVKHFTWPHYVTAARARFRCRATLVVVAVDQRVARWCAMRQGRPTCWWSSAHRDPTCSSTKAGWCACPSASRSGAAT